MKIVNIRHIIVPLLIAVLFLSSYSYFYRIDSQEVLTGKTEFQLSYKSHIQNNGPLNLTSMSLRLAMLKSWGQYQTVNSELISPAPNRTSTDEYDNMFGWYEFNDFLIGQSLDVAVNVNMTLNFIDYASIDFGKIIYDKNDKLYQLYSAYDSLADTSNPRLISVVDSFKSDSSDVIGRAFEAYNFTASFLKYKLLSTSRGADFALSNGYGDCDEYTNLFIALARAMGIPAIAHTAWLVDFTEGLVTTDNGVAAHAFPMFYIPEVGMISADPTRGKDRLFDNWMKTDYQRITMTRGPDHPYRLLKYKWIPVEGIGNPDVFHNYTISIEKMNTVYTSTMRYYVLGSLVFIPLTFLAFNVANARKYKEKQRKMIDQLLNP